jgi:hypothetical protein
MSQDYMVYDIETKFLPNEIEGGWSNVYGMEMASGVVWHSKTNQFYFFGGEETERERICQFLNGQTAVTFNGIHFDSKVLLGNDRIIENDGTTKNDKYSWKNVDIFIEMWKRILGCKDKTIPEVMELQKSRKDLHVKGLYNLDTILWNTLRIRKNGDGAEAPKLYKQGKIRELFQYNLQDTRCERDLYLFIKKYKYIINGNFDVVEF